MNQNLILWPLLAQIALTICMYGLLLKVKVKELKAGTVDREKTAIDQDLWPHAVRLVNNNLRNQFETPVLFYALCVLLWGLRAVDAASLAIAGLYVAARGVHAYIHTTSNDVKYRTPVFAVSLLLLTVLLGFTVRALVRVS